MKLFLLTCVIAVSVALNCTSPLLRRRHHQLRPKDLLNESVIAPDSLPVCKPLEGKEVCCGKPAWEELRENFNHVKDRFKKWVEKRTDRIKKIKDDFKDSKADFDVSDLVAESEALLFSDAAEMFNEDLRCKWEEENPGK